MKDDDVQGFVRHRMGRSTLLHEESSRYGAERRTSQLRSTETIGSPSCRTEKETIIAMPAAKTGLIQEQQHAREIPVEITQAVRRIQAKTETLEIALNGQCPLGDSCRFNHDSNNKDQSKRRRHSRGDGKEDTKDEGSKGNSPSGTSNKPVCSQFFSRRNATKHLHVILGVHQDLRHHKFKSGCQWQKICATKKNNAVAMLLLQ